MFFKGTKLSGLLENLESLMDIFISCFGFKLNYLCSTFNVLFMDVGDESRDFLVLDVIDSSMVDSFSAQSSCCVDSPCDSLIVLHCSCFLHFYNPL